MHPFKYTFYVKVKIGNTHTFVSIYKKIQKHALMHNKNIMKVWTMRDIFSLICSEKPDMMFL